MKHKCLTPNLAWYCGTVRSKSDGVISPHLVFSRQEALEYFQRIGGRLGDFMMERHAVSVPCGKCAACKIRQRKEWATRLSHECQCWQDNCCFVTLTYNDDTVPVTCFNPLKSERKLVDRGVGELPLQTLLVSDVQKFIKRLRRHLEYRPKRLKDCRDHIENPLRYYVVGEYGSKSGRPHYHLLLFGWKPSDMKVHDVRNGHPVFRSSQIEKLWRYGFSTVEPVKGNVAQYCARYVTKKFARLSASDPFADSVFPEFCLQSVRNGGIGATWFDRNYESCLMRGFCTVRVGSNYVKQSIPKYYWNRCRKRDVALWLQLREERISLVSSSRLSPQSYDDLVRSVECFRLDQEREAQMELI